MKRVFFSSFLVLQLVGCTASADAGSDHMKDVIIFYLSFDVDTYVPATIESIEKEATCRFVLRGDARAAMTLRRAVENAGEGDFDDRVVRVKASGLVEQTVFIDVDGGVLLGTGGAERRLGEGDFTTVKALLESLAKEEGCGE